MAIGGADSIRVLRQLEADHAHLTENYLAHHQAFRQLHHRLYTAGTVVEDALIDSTLPSRRPDLSKRRTDLDKALQAYSNSGSGEERDLVIKLKTELGNYWKVVDSAMAWDAPTMRRQGPAFLHQEILPRRTRILNIADRMGALNDRALHVGDVQSAQVFERFRNRTIGVLGLTLTFGFGVAALSIAHILGLAKDARLRYDEVLRARSELQRLSAKLVDAQEQERRAISRELHDEVGQSLSALLIETGNLSAIAPCAGNPEASHVLESIRRLGESSLSAVRNIALLLRPSMLDDLGLTPALRWQARELSRRSGIRVEVAAGELADNLTDDYKTCIYRVVQEALHNTERHAHARKAQVVVTKKGDRLLVMIKDDGRGFDPHSTRGLGLIGMSERVRSLGGELEVWSDIEKGTIVRAEIPLPQGAAEVHEVTV